MVTKRCLPLSFLLLATLNAEDWPWWRGPSLQGISQERNIPTTWDTNTNIAWVADVPGDAWSSPIVHGNHVFLTTATEKGTECRVLAFDRGAGKLLWNTLVFTQVTKRKENKNSYATPTPATDGRAVYAAFGDGSFVAVDYSGKVLWQNREYPYYSQHGLGSSIVLHSALVIHARDWSSEGEDKRLGWQKPWDQSFLVALDAKTGKQVWKASRGMSRIGHVTPNIIQGKPPVLVSGAGDVVQGFDLQTGKLLWTGRSQGEGVVPSIVIGGGLVYSCSGFEQPTIRAFRPGGAGDVTQSHLAWEQTKGVPMISSLLYVEPFLYSITTNGIAHCYRAATGELVWQERIGGNYSASPVWANSKIYFASEEGDITVIDAGPVFRQVAKNALGEMIQASPAISRGQIFIRTQRKLYAIGKPAVR